AVIGTGVIGAGWATRCLVRGIDVVAADPGPDAEAKLRASLENARPAAVELYGSATVEPGTLTFVDNIKKAVEDADFIQESAPERENLKRRLHAEIDAAARPGVIIASSSSGLMPSVIQADCRHPERVLIGHPFNPVYLLPLCEVVGGEATSAENIRRACAFYRSIGMYALHVRKEIEGYLSDRLQEAMWREILHLVNDGVATTGELDDAIKYGPGLRWAIMGTSMIFHLAGGDAGMRHMLHQFGPALKLPWTRLEAPELSDELIGRLVEGTREQAEGKTVRELEQLRDNCLIDIMRALKKYDTGAGKVLAGDEARREAGG
ncbi:MAG: L-carnitine dehydrogenase, partial [Alphaproteobacteria bacterium]